MFVATWGVVVTEKGKIGQDLKKGEFYEQELNTEILI